MLEGDSTTTARRPLLGEGKVLLKPNSSQVKLPADQMEASPDGKYYYFQTASRLMYRVETQYPDNFNTPSAEIARHISYFFSSPTGGSPVIDADGNLYVSDTNQKRVLKVTPAGQSSTLVQSPSLIWVDAMWKDYAGNLWLPVPQLNRTAGFQKGGETVKFPV